MLTTYCTNGDCPEEAIAKEVPEGFEDVPITCGICGEPCVQTKEMDIESGEKIA